MERIFHVSDIGTKYIVSVCVAAVLIFVFSIITGCVKIPEKIVVGTAPSEGQASSGWRPDAAAPNKKTGNSSSSKINLSDTKKFYVGVMDVNLSGKISPDMKLPLTNAIIGVLVSLNKFLVIDRANRDSMLAEIGFQQTGCVDNACSVQAGRLLGVNRMVVCTVSLIGNTYNITVQVLNVETGQIEGFSGKSIFCKEEDLIGWVKLTTSELFK